MSEDIEVGAEARQAVMLAVMSAGDPSNEQAWKTRVQRNLPTFAALVRDGYGFWGKEAQKIIDSQVFTGTYTGAELEESSKRMIVHITSSTGRQEAEAIRTERTDIPPGWEMQRRLQNLEPGTEIAAFKRVEVIGPDKKVRVLVHFEPVRSKKSVESTEPSRNRPAEPRSEGRADSVPSRSAGVSSSPPRADQTLSAEALAVQRGMSEMGNRQKIAVKNRCVGEGIADWADPGPESIDRVLTIIKEAQA